MADDRELVIRFLNMVRGSLDEKNTRLLEELRLKRLIVLGGPGHDPDKPATPRVEKLPGQSAQDPAQKRPPEPDYENPKRKTARDTVAPSPRVLAARAR